MFPKRYWIVVCLTAVSSALFSGICVGELLGVTGSPKRTLIPDDTGMVINVRWVISTDPAHQAGASSAQGVLQDTVTNTVLKTVNLPLNIPTGTGPLHFEEPLALSSQEIEAWRLAGYQELHYSRLFGSAGNTQQPQKAWIAVAIAPAVTETPTRLVLREAQLQFKPQRFNRIVDLDSQLHVQLALNYSGTGEFSGFWQIAKLNDDTQSFNYESLTEASKTLVGDVEQDFLLSPRLPTDSPGIFRVRFCPSAGMFINSDQTITDKDCPQSQLSAALEYRVLKQGTLPSEVVSADNVPQANADSVFEWARVPNAVVYELLIYQVSRQDMINSDEFVSRLLVRSSQKTTQLTTETLAQLTPGAHYSWQVNAFDSHGELISQSPARAFLFMPNSKL